MVEQHRGDDARVAGVVVGDRGVRGVGAAEAFGRGGGIGDRGLHPGGVRGQDRRQDLAQRRLLGVCAQDVHVRLERVDVESSEQVGRFGGCAEAAEAVEVRQRADEFGLVVGVLVVAVRGVDRDAAALFVRVPLLRLGEVGVDLEGERGSGREDFEQEGQSRAELRYRSARPVRPPGPLR